MDDGETGEPDLGGARAASPETGLSRGQDSSAKR